MKYFCEPREKQKIAGSGLLTKPCRIGKRANTRTKLLRKKRRSKKKKRKRRSRCLKID